MWALSMAIPIGHTLKQAMYYLSLDKPSVEYRTDRQAEHWIESHIAANASILLVGWYPATLPRIVANSPKAQAVWGEYFMYKRGLNTKWIKAFMVAYSKLESKHKRPFYRIYNIRKHYHAHHLDERLNNLFSYGLARLALANKIEYIVTASPDKFTGKWEKSNMVKLLVRFSEEEGRLRGAEVKIFEIVK